ncbi:MAG: hypothetical protein AAF944_18755 [Bacteroidota bacterium]
MKNFEKDREWQRRLDAGQYLRPDKDEPGTQAYQLLYEALKQEPNINIPESFAEKVAQQALVQQTRQGNGFWLLSFTLITLASIVCGGLLFYLYPDFIPLLRSQISIWGFAGLMFVIIQVADYWLIQRKQLLRFS